MAILEEVTGFVISSVSDPVNVGWVAFGVVALLVVLFFFNHFLELALDMWKIPFAIVVDALDLLSYDNPYFDIASAFGAFLLLWVFAKKNRPISKIIGILVIAECLVGVWILPQYAFITNLLPSATLFTFLMIKRH
jgi:hypothetical protein